MRSSFWVQTDVSSLLIVTLETVHAVGDGEAVADADLIAVGVGLADGGGRAATSGPGGGSDGADCQLFLVGGAAGAHCQGYGQTQPRD